MVGRYATGGTGVLIPGYWEKKTFSSGILFLFKGIYSCNKAIGKEPRVNVSVVKSHLNIPQEAVSEHKIWLATS